MRRFQRSLLIWSALAMLVACETSPAAPDAPLLDATSSMPSCAELVRYCHDVDPGTGAIHTCHQLGHQSSLESACAAQLESCIQLCTLAAEHDASHADAGPSSDAHAHHH